MSQLYDYLSTLAPGAVEDQAELVRHLRASWDALRGSNQSAMATWKLSRLESPRWEPPLLSFAVERHGAIVGGGSTRAEMQHWVVDPRSGTARIQGLAVANSAPQRLASMCAPWSKSSPISSRSAPMTSG